MQVMSSFRKTFPIQDHYGDKERILRVVQRKKKKPPKERESVQRVPTTSGTRVYPTRSVESSVNWYSGTSRFSGAGPLRIRPDAS